MNIALAFIRDEPLGLPLLNWRRKLRFLNGYFALFCTTTDNIELAMSQSLSTALFTRNVCVWINVNVNRNIVLMMTEMEAQRMRLRRYWHNAKHRRKC